MRRLLVALAVTAAVMLAGQNTALAWRPILTGSATCADNGWSVTWTVTSNVNGKGTWWVLSPAGYNPNGEQDDELAFTRTTHHSFDDASATETVSVDWSKAAPASTAATVSRPEGCQAATTTSSTTTSTSSTTTSTTSTTVPDTSTTTVPDTTSTTGPGTTAPAGSSTTTTVASSSTGSSTSSQPPPSVRALPVTGAGDSIALIASVIVALGVALTIAAARSQR